MTAATRSMICSSIAAGLVGCSATVQTDDLARLPRAAGELQLHVVNVQQGSALLAIGPDGTTMLVDGGKSGPGSSELAPYLASLGYPDGAQLDYVVATHMDADHIGGLTSLLQDHAYDVGVAVYDNGSTKTGAFIEDYDDAVASTTAGPAQAIPLGTVIPLGGGATATAVAVHGDVLGVGPIASVSDENDLSVAMLIQHGDFDLIVAGDLGGGDDDSACTDRVHSSANVETPLAQALTDVGGLLGPDGLEVMIVNHHGSHSSTNHDWFDRLSPSVAVIAVGPNSYGHPRQVVVDNVLQAGAACVSSPAALVLQTDEGDTDHASATMTGRVVGDVVFDTSGVGSFHVSASGELTTGSDERVAAGLPATFPMDEVSACVADEDCDDEDECNGIEVCALGRCQPGVAPPCEEGDACSGVDGCGGAEPSVLAADDWESGGLSGGSGWAADWSIAGDFGFSGISTHSGTTVMRLRGATGYAERAVDLSGVGGARLQLWARVDSFEPGDSADIRVSADGTSFTTVHTFDDGDSDNVYHFIDIDLSGFAMSTGFTVAFVADMNTTGDRLYIDDIEIVGTL